MPNKPPSPLVLVGLGSGIVAMIIGGMAAGWAVDASAHAFPVFTLVGLAVGIIAASFYMYSLYRRFKRD
ncbi:MAG TPA: AtpZ/AtpI family protein [Pseudonocardiaceae bacterium]|nr:AtpZ/AtpI family protein [Pseudonocardiaceae bacterium]